LEYLLSPGFEAPQSEVEFLRRRLAEEQANAERSNLARLEAETRCHLAEKERDVYRLLARRWKSRLNVALGEHDEGNSLIEAENIEEAAAAMLLGGRENMSMFGFGGIFRRLRAVQALSFERDEDSDDSEANEGMFEQEEGDRMEEDEDEMHEEMVDHDDNDDASFSLVSADDVARSAVGFIQPEVSAESSDVAKAIAARPQVRTVSISGADL
jgi:hypothetical protein